MNMRELSAELLGTFWLVLGGVGTAMLAASEDTGNVGVLGVSIAFGLTVLTGAYALAHISGAHFNPAVTLGLVAGDRFPASKVPGYIGAQVLGALIAAGLIAFLVAESGADIGTLASNEYNGDFAPLLAVLVAEFVLTAVFVVIIMGATAKRGVAGFGGVAIGLALTLIHLISIPVSNTSVNPARSAGPAIVAAVDGTSGPLGQLWVFWLAPIVGGIVGGLLYKTLLDDDSDPVGADA